MRTHPSPVREVDQMSKAVLAGILPAPRRRRPHAPRKPARRSRIITEELFREVALKEQKRADRTNQSVVMLLVAAKDPLGDHAPSMWAPILDALSDVAREIDVLGWFEWRAVAGVILPEMSVFTESDAVALEARVRQQILMRSDTQSAERFTIRLHVHPEPKLAAEAPATAGGSLAFPTLHPRPEWTVQMAAKRALDVVGSAALLLALAPLFMLIAAISKIVSPGPVFFRQVRIGQLKKPFEMFKFRTMYVNNDPKLHQEYMAQFIAANAQAQGSSPAQPFKIAHDPRITPFGRFLRKTSLDELPQLWNVLRGDMSLVGPRPGLAYEFQQYKPWHCRRVLEAKPGITGLWQVTGRSRTTFDQMVRLDLRYARTCSPWTDLKILFATPAAVISGRGAC